MKQEVLGFALCALSSSSAVALPEELLNDPQSEVTQFYIENSAIVDELLMTLRAGADTGKRLGAFYQLIKEYPDAATIAARDYVIDPDANVANVAIAQLMNDLVMTNHHHGSMEQVPPGMQRIMMSLHKSREALRKALRHPIKDVRLRVAKYFASQSDSLALDVVQASVEAGLYAEEDAVKIFSLSKGRVATRYLEPYLEKGNDNSRETAIAVLGFFPQYQDRIRTVYFANSDAPVVLRKQAATILGKYDRRFAEYALTVATEDNVPAAVFAPTMESYVESLGRKHLLDTQTARKLDKKIKDYILNTPTLKSTGGEYAKRVLENVSRKLSIQVEGKDGIGGADKNLD